MISVIQRSVFSFDDMMVWNICMFFRFDGCCELLRVGRNAVSAGEIFSGFLCFGMFFRPMVFGGKFSGKEAGIYFFLQSEVL